MSVLTVQYTWATRSAFVDERPAFAYVIIFTFDRFLANPMRASK